MFAVSVSKKRVIIILQGRLSESPNNKCKSRLLKNLLKLGNLVDIGGVSL